MNSLLHKAVEAAIAAGKAITLIYNDPERDFSIEIKSDNSPLTIADRRSHEVIMSFLTDTEYPVLSEEGRTIPFDIRKEWSTLWIVDPLDGTKEFIKRNDEFTVNIALVRNGVPVLGVIYVPVTGVLYFAADSIGSFKVKVEDGEAAVSAMSRADKLPYTAEQREFVVVASRSHMSVETEQFISNLRKEHGEVVLKSSGSSLKICMVAEGTANVYPRFAPTMEWDTAAGHAIALYAGKNMYKDDFSGPLIYNKENLLNPWFIVE